MRAGGCCKVANKYSGSLAPSRWSPPALKHKNECGLIGSQLNSVYFSSVSHAHSKWLPRIILSYVAVFQLRILPLLERTRNILPTQVLTFATALCHSLRRWPTDSVLLATDCVLLRALTVAPLRRTGTLPCSDSGRLRQLGVRGAQRPRWLVHLSERQAVLRRSRCVSRPLRGRPFIGRSASVAVSHRPFVPSVLSVKNTRHEPQGGLKAHFRIEKCNK